MQQHKERIILIVILILNDVSLAPLRFLCFSDRLQRAFLYFPLLLVIKEFLYNLP